MDYKIGDAMTEVGDYVRIKNGVLRDKIGIVTDKYYGNGSYLFNCYVIKDIKSEQYFEYYRKEFKQIQSDEAMVEML